MNTRSIQLTSTLAALVLLLSLGGCGGMSRQEKNTALGATAGGVAGAALGGGAIGTLGGAAAGGVLGHVLTKDKDKDKDKND